MFSLWVSILFYLKVFMHTRICIRCTFTPHICVRCTGLHSLRVLIVTGCNRTLSRGILELPILNSVLSVICPSYVSLLNVNPVLLPL